MFVHNIFRLKFLCGRILKICLMGGNVELFKSIRNWLLLLAFMIVLQTPKSRQYILLATDLYFIIVQ